MFSLLVHGNSSAWETDQRMRMIADRFKEYSPGAESQAFDLKNPASLKALDGTTALLMYERGAELPEGDVVRYGVIRNVHFEDPNLAFDFSEEGRLDRGNILEFQDHLGMHKMEWNRTHWAIKDGGIPSALRAKLKSDRKYEYDIVFSFAGENRQYVEATAEYLRQRGVRLFYDLYEEAKLWGKDLSEHFEKIYRHQSRYCLIFISKAYVEKMWTRHERKSAISRAMMEEEYILPARFDDTPVPGILPITGYVNLRDRTPDQLGQLILEKLEVPEKATEQVEPKKVEPQAVSFASVLASDAHLVPFAQGIRTGLGSNNLPAIAIHAKNVGSRSAKGVVLEVYHTESRCLAYAADSAVWKQEAGKLNPRQLRAISPIHPDQEVLVLAVPFMEPLPANVEIRISVAAEDTRRLRWRISMSADDVKQGRRVEAVPMEDEESMVPPARIELPPPPRNEPTNALAKYLLDKIRSYQDKEKRGLTVLLKPIPGEPSATGFFVSLVPSGELVTARKLEFRSALHELTTLGWLSDPEVSGIFQQFFFLPDSTAKTEN